MVSLIAHLIAKSNFRHNQFQASIDCKVSFLIIWRIDLKANIYCGCNVMITGPADHGLHVIFFATAMSSSSYRLIIATTSSPLYQFGSISVLALFGTEIPRVACELKQFALIVGSQRLLADQCLFRQGQA